MLPNSAMRLKIWSVLLLSPELPRVATLIVPFFSYTDEVSVLVVSPMRQVNGLFAYTEYVILTNLLSV